VDKLKRIKTACDNGHADHGIGYRRPPERTRFKPGQSGNPRGRPKGARNFKTDLKTTLRMPVSVTRHGKSQRVSTQQAVLMRLREKALSGDTRGLVQLIVLAQSHNNEEVIESRGLSANDEAILEIFKRRVLSGAAATYDPAEDQSESIDSVTRTQRFGEGNRKGKPRRVRLKSHVHSDKRKPVDNQTSNENED
jgi:Family of unknown function (DUF5681)